MERVRLTGTDLQVSRICLGGWQIGGMAFGPIADEDVDAIFGQALDLGIDFFDLAPSYGRNRAEELAGRYLPRDAVIATKVGLVWDEMLEVRRDLSAAVVHRQVRESLRRLRRDVIDLYLVHWPDGTTPEAETFGALADIQAAGLVRHIGACNYDRTGLAAARAHAPVAVLQSRFNLLERDTEPDIEWCQAHGVGFMAHSSLATGLLTGKYGSGTTFDDARSRFDLYQGDRFQAAIAAIEQLRSEASDLGRSLLEHAMRFLLDAPGVDVAIVGTRNPEQLRGLVAEVYQCS